MDYSLKKNIALMAGGFSGERDISIQSARTIASHLDPERYEVYSIEVNPQNWLYHDSGSFVSVDKTDFSLILNGRKIRFDAAFIAIHGTPGEDGKLQGYFDMLDIPYNTCGAIASALTFNKWFCNQVVRTLNEVQVSNGVHVVQGHVPDLDKLASLLVFPVFVKPNEGGSSIGMSKVGDRAGLAEALQKAFREDNQVLIEEYVKGREFTCGVFEHRGRLQVLPITEIRSSKDFFDYEAKYTLGGAQEICPARISDELTKRMQDLSKKAHHALGLKGYSRTDMILKDGSFYLLETNTIPGMTRTSLLPLAAKTAGVSFSQLLDRLINLALEKPNR